MCFPPGEVRGRLAMLEPDSGLGGMRMSLEKTEQLRDLGRESCLKEASIGPCIMQGAGVFTKDWVKSTSGPKWLRIGDPL
jgi:hypothetical protein